MFEFICGFATRLKEAVYRLFGVELNQDRLNAERAGVDFYEWLSAKRRKERKEKEADVFGQLPFMFQFTEESEEVKELISVYAFWYMEKHDKDIFTAFKIAKMTFGEGVYGEE